MALLWCDSFDYATDDLVYKYITYGSPTTTTGQSRWSGKRSLLLPSAQHYVNFYFSLTQELYFGFAVYHLGQANSYSSTQNTVLMLNGSSSQAQLAFEICNPAGVCSISSASGGGLASGGSVTASTWHYVEIWYKYVNGSSDRCKVKINGIEVIDYTGDLSYATAGVAIVRLYGGYSSGPARYFQDLYACDTTGSTNNSWLGDIRVQAIRPNGAGNYSQFTPLAGSNYENVDDTDIDGDSSYVSGTAVGVRDTYTMEDISGNRRIYAVASNIVASKASAGANFLKPTLRISSTDYERPALGFGVGYSSQQSIFETSPATDDEFTISEVNALESGFTLYASTTTTTV